MNQTVLYRKSNLSINFTSLSLLSRSDDKDLPSPLRFSFMAHSAHRLPGNKTMYITHGGEWVAWMGAGVCSPKKAYKRVLRDNKQIECKLGILGSKVRIL